MKDSWAVAGDCAGAEHDDTANCQIPIADLKRLDPIRSQSEIPFPMSKIIVLMGAPGAGKGTEGRLLQERQHLPQISTGDMFRELAESHTPLAEEVRAIQQSGRLIPDELVIRVVEGRTAKDDDRNGYILDGFPRTAVQAEMLEELAARQNRKLKAILLDVPLELLEKRMTGRRICPICKEIYNIYFRPAKVDNKCYNHPEAQLDHR